MSLLFRCGPLMNELLAAQDAIVVGVEAFEARGRLLGIGLVGEEFFAGQFAIAVCVLACER